MALYSVTDWTSDPGTVEEVLAAAETYLETIDSTSNSIVDSGLVQLGSANFQFWIIHNA